MGDIVTLDFVVLFIARTIPLNYTCDIDKHIFNI